ncbi:MAG: ABC-F family ATP-binding cassette domain-containing protein [Caulobacterales bacterium]
MSRVPAPIAQFKDVRLSLGGAPLFSGVAFALSRGDRACLIGANGVGKSTLMRILAGALDQDSGEVFRQPGVRMIYVPQEPSFAGFDTLHDYAAHGLDDAGRRAAEYELSDFGLDPERSCEGLSGGESRRAALARAFAAEPDLLLLDEPTNHLDIEAIEMLEARLMAYRGSALIVSHDRRFLERVSTACLWLRNGQVQRLDRGFGAFEEWAEQVESAEADALQRLETQLRDEERWLQRGVTARRSRNEGRRRKLMAMRSERRERSALLSKDGPSFSMEAGESSGRLVLEAKKLSKSWLDADGAPKTVVQSFDIRITRGDRIGIVGPNGAGKSTLLKLLLGEIAPDEGSVRKGSNVTIAHLDQMRDTLDSKATIWDTLAPLGGDQVLVRGNPRHVAAYAGDFLFAPKQLRQPVGALSGGERNRLLLAVAMTKTANLLVLDEPTNDLDMETLDLLEDTLSAYDGTLLLVSHDRAFLDGVVTSILAPLGDGRWAETPGSYSDYERERATRLQAREAKASKAAPIVTPASTPKRETKKLSYKDERRLAEIETLMPKTQAAIAALETRLADPALYSKSPAEAAALADKLDAERAKLETMELEWLELEEKKQLLA